MTSLLQRFSVRGRYWRLLLRHILRYRRAYGAGIALLLLSNGFNLLIPWALKHAVEALQRGLSAGRVAQFALLIAAAATLQAIVRSASRLTILGSSRRVETDMRNALFGQLTRLPASFYHRMRTGDILSRATNDLRNIRAMAGPGVMNVANTVIVYGAAVAFMARIHPRLTLLVLIPFPLFLIALRHFSHRFREKSNEVQQELSDISSHLQEVFSGIQVVKSYGQEEAMLRRFQERNVRYYALNMDLVRLRGLLIPLVGGIGGVGTVIVLWLGGRAVIAGTITLGDFVAFNGYLAMLSFPTIALGWVIGIFQRGMASLERVEEILAAVPEIRDTPPLVRPREIGGGLQFEGVTFAYPNGAGPRAPAALREVQLEVPPGAWVGIMGPVGSGKSTLLRLVPRLFDPQAGRVLLDGLDVRRLPLDALRRGIGYVTQDPFLFSASLRRNISFSRPGAPPEEVEGLVEAVQLAGEVEGFPEGLDTVVGERGVTLSGGQRQRVALARALLGDPPLLLLDDPLSNVDVETEGRILRALRRLRAGRTTLIASHRVSTLREADLVVVLDGGEIREEGSPEELLERGGLFARYWRRQQLETELEGL